MDKKNNKLKLAQMSALCETIELPEQELHVWFKRFLRVCPNRKLDKAQFITIQQIFIPSEFVKHTFCTFDGPNYFTQSVTFEDKLKLTKSTTWTTSGTSLKMRCLR